MKKVLVIDDQSCVRQMVRGVLEQWHYPLEVEEAADGMEALVNAECRDYDLLICDVKMPILDGFEVLKKLRSQDSTKHVPVIMLTAEDQPEAIADGLSWGATSYVTKPFNLEDLLEALRHHI